VVDLVECKHLKGPQGNEATLEQPYIIDILE